MGMEEELVAAATIALQGEPARAMEAICRAVVGLGFPHAQVVCLEQNRSRCLATTSQPPAPIWIDRELRSNRSLRHSVRQGASYRSREYATYPLFGEGGVAGALLVGLRRAGPDSTQVPPAILRLLSATLQAYSRAQAQSAQLRQARAALRQQESAATHLVRRLALARHDLKAPLVPVKGYLDMMLRGMAGPVTPTSQRYLERSKQSVDRLRDLIDYRLRDPVLPTVDLRLLVREVVTGRRRPVRLHLPDEPCWVVASPPAVTTALHDWIRGMGATADPQAPLELFLSRGELGWELTLSAGEYATLPVRVAQRCAALLESCGGRLLAGPTGVRAILPFDPRVEIAPPAGALAPPSPRPASPVAAPPAEAADRG